ncbi:recombinase family protein [Anaerotruncus colihominis]|uniref:Recombinase family protein n=1 Tax=Anaerotruncus colihominis TaxID=169435 RepID=A0A845T0E3_9FIRM|nr:recombinase family protein [Anaerotruncus colihominis]MCR2024930.1 recombinase family protein [Anaerotruncus colihominis]NDO40223.1 recombinase family protein [Anaerotruncus colihominis]
MTCAVYCRLSREDGDGVRESESIQNQRALLTEYAAAHGWKVYAAYCDDDCSGADRTRPAFNRMLRDARDKKFEIVLCKTQSRFTRDLELVEKYIHGLFPLWGIRFIAVVDHVDTALRGNKKARQINGLVNEWYLEDLSENIRAVFAQKRRAGQYIGSFPAYGYEKDPADHNHLIIDPLAAETVRLIFSLCLSGMGKQKIAAQLNRRGIPNPTAYKRARGWTCPGGKSTLWSRATVGRILHNELYTGTMVQGIKHKISYKSDLCVSVPREAWIRVPGTHEAIIEPQVFHAVQSLLARRARSDGSGQTHPLAGLVRCGACGAAMIRVSHTYKGKKRSYLQCGRYASDRAGAPCTRHSTRLDALTDAVEHALCGQIAKWYDPGEPARLYPEKPGGKTGCDRRQAAALRAQLARREAALRALYLDRTDGTITPEQFSALSASFQAESDTLRGRLAALETQAVQAPDIPPVCMAQQIQDLLSPARFFRPLAALLIDRIEIDERDPQQATQAIRIFWKF